MLSVVVDTNVFVSALLCRDSLPSRIIKMILREEMQCSISEDLLLELETVLRRPKFDLSKKEIDSYLRLIKNNCVSQKPKERLFVIEDDPDNRVLECAIAGNADYIISGDKHLLSLKEYQGIEILSSKEFLDMI